MSILFRIFAPVMPNPFFQFRQFTVFQDKCAMKVGTDGTLLGAWAQGGKRILDIGTGTGLIALMMAQRYPEARVTAIDIDRDACEQALENIRKSPFSERIKIVNAPLQQFCQASFDAIVSNPPFFTNALRNPDEKRSTARHTDTLPFKELFQQTGCLLTADGTFSAVIPFDCRESFDLEAILNGFFPWRVCAVKTVTHKPPRRYLLSYGLQPLPHVETSEIVIRSSEYEKMLGDFYL